jgi:hypothetical protein
MMVFTLISAFLFETVMMPFVFGISFLAALAVALLDPFGWGGGER